MKPVDEKMAKDLKGKSRDAFDAQAATYDADMHGSHARSLYPHVIDEVKRAVEGIDSSRLLDLGCGTGLELERLLKKKRCWKRSPTPVSHASTFRRRCWSWRRRDSLERRMSFWSM